MFAFFNTVAKKLLPPWVYALAIGRWDRDGLKKYFSNVSWIFFAKIISFVVSFFTIAFVARYLGPENYGKLSYAQSFVAIFSVFAALGIDQILYRDLVAKPDHEATILGTAFFTKLVFGTLTFCVTTGSALFLNGNTIFTWLIGLIALTFILQPFGVISHYFHAQVKAKYASYVTIFLSFFIPALKLLVIFSGQGIIYFAAIIAVESLILALSYVWVYHYVFRRSLAAWSFSLTTFLALVHDSWPLFVASLSGYMYGRIDQVLLMHYIDASAVGIYDAAVRLVEISGFFPGVLITALFPAIVNARTSNRNEYQKRLRALNYFSLSIAGVIALIVFILAPYLVTILYGSAFTETTTILRIYIWSLFGAIAVSLIQNYLIAENRAASILLITVCGAICNALLNLLLIPTLGIYGAAYTTLISYGLILTLFMILVKRKKTP